MLTILRKSPGALSKLGSDGVITVVDALMRQSMPPPVTKPQVVQAPAQTTEPPATAGEAAMVGTKEAATEDEPPSLKARIENMRAAIEKDLPAPTSAPPPPPPPPS